MEGSHKIKVGLYQHYKGDKYQVLFLGQDKITDKKVVIYKALNQDKYYTRTIENFLSEVKIEDKVQPRFTFLEPNSSDSWEERYIRALADYQNLLKQSAKDKQDFYKYSLESFLHEILPVYDNLKVAVKGLSKEEQNNAWVEGIRYVIKQFAGVLQAQGVEEIKTVGEKFDPNSMEAVADKNNKSESSSEMICKQEIKSGYKLNGKVIIPAKVIVK